MPQSTSASHTNANYQELIDSVENKVSQDRDPNLATTNQSSLAPMLNNLSIPELMTIFNIPDNVQASDVITNYVTPFINEYKPSEQDKRVLYAAGELVQNYIQNVDYDANSQPIDQTNVTLGEYKLEATQKPGQLYNWLHNEALAQGDPLQTSRYVDRLGTVDVANADTAGNHSIMKRKAIGVYQSTAIPVAQGTMNPTLRNTVKHLMTIDSANRQNVMTSDIDVTVNPDGIASSTNFLMKFSHPLTEVLSYTLTSATIPFTFYNIDENLGNNFFYVDDGVDISLVCLSGGNYDALELVNDINAAVTPFGLGASYQSKTHKIIFTGGPTDISLIFYDTSGNYTGCEQACGSTTNIDTNLGYLMGFRSQVSLTQPVSSISIPAGSTITPPMAINLNNSNYFVIVIDDFNNNYVNMNQTIQNDTRPIIMETINATDLSYVCVSDHPTHNVRIEPSAPRKLTNAQIAAINANSSYKLGRNVRASAGEIANSFAVLPFLTDGLSMGQSIVITDSLEFASRTFFGSTDIDKFRVRLVDRYGRTVNLHGNDWFFTLQIERLYQY